MADRSGEASGSLRDLGLPADETDESVDGVSIDSTLAVTSTYGGGARVAAVPPATVPTLAVEVVWADITKVTGDVYAVGHYEQVPPQNAELALDRVVSGPDAGDDGLVLTSLTRRGILRGALGDVAFFPWARSSRHGAETRVVAVAGMGRVGGFGALELRQAARNLAWAVSALPDARVVCTVLIGGGTGNLTLAEAVYGLVAGMADAMVPGAWRAPVNRLRIVEKELGRARAVAAQLPAVRDLREVRARVALDLGAGEVVTGEGGHIGADYCLALTLAAAAAAARGDGDQQAAVDRLLGAVPEPAGFRDAARERLLNLAATGNVIDATNVGAIAGQLSVSAERYERGAPAPTRLTFVRDGAAVCAAALTDTTVIPERRVDVDDALLSAAAHALVNADVTQLLDASTFLTRLVVPRDFRASVERAPRLIVEVDRAMAKLPWEMLADRADGTHNAQHIALKVEVARQLRTAYAAPPGVERVARWPLRALVVGDPGDPARGESLPGARQEALAVARLLRTKEVGVTLMVGAPGADRGGDLRGVEPAGRLEVLRRILSGDYDLLHYAGHGGFDPAHPDETGWVFQDGLLTSRLLDRLDVAPSLVVANACLSARTSEALARGATAGAARSEADLLPGLADEFFRRGVRNYIGTAWEINDEGAVEFARVFYDTLIPDADEGRRGERPPTVGGALREARLALHRQEARYRALWGAYQHYGDPQHVIVGARASAPLPPAHEEARRGATAPAEVVARGGTGESGRTAAIAEPVAAPIAPAITDAASPATPHTGVSTARPASRRATSHAALLIGVRRTGKLPTLNAVYRGVEQMRAWLETQPGFRPEVPNPDSGEAMNGAGDGASSPPAIVTLTDEHAPVTAEAIRRCVRAFVDLGTVTQLIVYFAGHGVNLRFSEYWLLSGAPDAANEAVNVRGSADEARYCGIPHVVFVSDACRTPAHTIAMQAVQGTLVFPTGDVTREPGSVDLFYASRVGRPALEVRPEAEAFRAVYTDALLEGLAGTAPIDLVPSPRDAAVSLVGPWALKHFLRRRVPALLTELKVGRDVSQEPDAIITSESGRVWLAEVPRASTAPATRGAPGASPGGERARGGVPEPPLPVSPADVAMAGLRSVLGGGAAERGATRTVAPTSVAPTSDAPAVAEFRRLLDRIPDTPTMPAPAERTRAARRAPSGEAPAFVVSGARVVEAVTGAGAVRLLPNNDDGVRLPPTEARAANVLLVFEDGRGALLPRLAGYSGVLVYDTSNGELASVAYEPSGADARSADDARQLGEAHELRRMIAAAAALGVFQSDAVEDREALLARLRPLVGLDPGLAVYAAYALYEGQRVAELRDLDRDLRARLGGVSLFDVAMLARAPGAVVPALPLLAQGWALVDARGVALPPSLGGGAFRRYVTDSLWTVFAGEGVDLVRKAINSGEIR